MQTEEDLRGDDLKHYEAEIEAMNLILISIPNDIYNSVDTCTTAQAMWQRVEPKNDLERNGIKFLKVTVNTKFLNCLQPEWLNYVTQVRLAKILTEDTYDDLFNYLQQFENRAKKLEKSHDPFALVANTVQNKYEDPLTSAMIVLARAITQRFYNPTNNRHRIAANVQSYNCSEKGHYARNCPKPRVQDLKYFMEQMFAIKNRIQPANFDSYVGPSYDSVFLSENPKLYDASFLDDSKIHVNVRDTEDILDDATKSQIKMKKKSQDPIAIEKKQNVWTIDYKKLNALYEDFVPQKEFSAEQKYFSSSFISSENSSNASSPSSSSETKPTVAPMPSANPMKLDLNKMENMILKHCLRYYKRILNVKAFSILLQKKYD
ncbi:retrovirus-related pol polyprotein from transposon TNT 1-94 [Tanacetum coccineum]